MGGQNSDRIGAKADERRMAERNQPAKTDDEIERDRRRRRRP
jgi:hypothetical protein